MREGRCYVRVNEGVNKFDPAILQVVSQGEKKTAKGENTLKEVGSFGKTANGVNTLAVNASFRSTASKGEIAILEILRKDII